MAGGGAARKREGAVGEGAGVAVTAGIDCRAGVAGASITISGPKYAYSPMLTIELFRDATDDLRRSAGSTDPLADPFRVDPVSDARRRSSEIRLDTASLDERRCCAAVNWS